MPDKPIEKDVCKCGFAGAKAIFHMMRARHVAPWDRSFDQELSTVFAELENIEKYCKTSVERGKNTIIKLREMIETVPPAEKEKKYDIEFGNLRDYIFGSLHYCSPKESYIKKEYIKQIKVR